MQCGHEVAEAANSVLIGNVYQPIRPTRFADAGTWVPQPGFGVPRCLPAFWRVALSAARTVNRGVGLARASQIRRVSHMQTCGAVQGDCQVVVN